MTSGLLPIFEHVDTHFPNSPILKPQKSIIKGGHIRKSSPLPLLPKIIHIEEIPIIFHKYIERVVDVKGDDNCGYHIVSSFLNKGENNNNTFVLQHLVRVLKAHNESYTNLYKKKTF